MVVGSMDRDNQSGISKAFDRRIELSREQFMEKYYPPELEPDMHFMVDGVEADVLKLDPYQKVDSSNWKEHCTMRAYFAQLAEMEKENTVAYDDKVMDSVNPPPTGKKRRLESSKSPGPSRHVSYEDNNFPCALVPRLTTMLSRYCSWSIYIKVATSGLTSSRS